MTCLLKFTINVRKSHEKQAIFVHELENAWRLIEGFVHPWLHHTGNLLHTRNMSHLQLYIKY